MNYRKIIILMACLSLLVSACGNGGGGKTYPRYNSGDNEFLRYTFTMQKNSSLGADLEGTITGNNIEITVPHGTNLKSLVAVFVTDCTDIKVNGVDQVNGETANDFSSDVIYTLTAENNDVKTYTVKVNIAPSSEKRIDTFYLNGTEAAIDQDTGIISVSLPPKTSLTSLTASFIAVAKQVLVGGAEQVSSETVNNFSGDVVYTVVAEDNSTRSYTVRVTVQKASWKELNTFAFNTAENSGLPINVTADFSGTGVSAVLPYGSSPSDLVATFTTTGEKVTVGGTEQKSGETHNNFISPVEYVVEAEDGTTETYSVTVTVAKNSARAITSFTLGGETSTIDENAGTITTVFPQAKNVTSLIASFITTGTGVMINGIDQVSGVTANDFTTDLIYRVTAEDGTYRDYTISAARSADITGIWNFDDLSNSDFTVYGTTQEPGLSGTSLQFNGSTDYVSVPDSPALTLAKAGTIEVLVKVNNYSSFGGIVHKGVEPDFSDETFSLQFWATSSSTNGRLRFLVTNSEGVYSYVDSKTYLALDKWYHIVATWDVTEGKIRIYINGTPDNEAVITTGDCRDSDGALVIGAQLPVYCGVTGWGNLGFNGLIDRVQLMSRAMTAEEISAKYAVLVSEESGLTAFILKLAPANKPLILTILLVILALIGGLWASNMAKHRKQS